MRTGIGIGSNLGERLAHLRRARREVLALRGMGEPFLSSRIYETEPVGTEPGAAPFLNAVIEAEFMGEPHALLKALQAVEVRMGRASKHPRNASRIIDLDLLYAGDQVFGSAEMVIPHPRLHLRRFVLQPLSDIGPELILPGQVASVAELLARLRDPARVEALAEPWDP